MKGKSVTFRNGSSIPVEATKISRNRYRDGVDWLYFETFSKQTPTVDYTFYHAWEAEDGTKLTGYLVRLSDVA